MRRSNGRRRSEITPLRREPEEERNYCPACRQVYSSKESCDCHESPLEKQRRLRPAA